MRVAIYARVSTVEQNAAMQLDELCAYCQRRQWEIAEKFIDSGVSGLTNSAGTFRTNRVPAEPSRGLSRLFQLPSAVRKCVTPGGGVRFSG